MKDLAEKISALSPEQRALFEARLRRKGLQTPEGNVIPRRAPTAKNMFPPSIDQERLWFIEQLQPGNSAYNIFTASRIKGALDAAIMERVVNAVIARHESLRTTFTVSHDQPMQVIAPELKISLVPVDLQSLPETEREREAMSIITEDFAAPFDLEKGPLIRVGLIKLAEGDHMMHVNMHHTVTDRWSGAIVEKETAALYQAFATGRPSPLAELPVQYADYAIWQRARMQGEVYQKDVDYWKERLTGAPLVIEVPTDYPRPLVQTFRGAHVFAAYPKRLLDALRELSRREGVTMFMLAMAAFKTLLYRYTGQEDIIVGSTFANRNRPELENLVGYFLNLLAFRTNLAGNPTFRELLVRERESALGAFAHQELPFGKLVQELRPKQDASRNPVVQASLIYLDFPELTVMQMLGLTATHLNIDNRASRFDITLALTETSDGYEVDIEFPTGLYERSRMEQMLRHLEVLFEGIVAVPERRLAELPLLTADEERRLLHEWNATATLYPHERCIHELVEARAAAAPQAVAVEFEGEQTTYGELNARANKLARYLMRLGVRAGVLTGICVEPSVEMVVGLLGILKAGGAYVPLDPAYPAARLSFMLNDAAVPVLLTQRSMLGSLPEHDARIVLLDAERESIAKESDANPRNNIAGESPAYVIYTSGSTGVPKGVLVSHRAVVNLLSATSREPGLTSDDLLLAVTTLSFDIAALEIFLPLSVGGRVRIISREVALDGRQLQARINGATVLHATPATWRVLIAAGWQGRRELTAFCGGEAMSRELADQLLERVGVLWNCYGPTETTIWSTIHRVEPGDGAVPVGRPLANMQLYVLDKFMNPVPSGIYGELHIGGEGLAHGYLNRPALCAQKFIPDPFSGQPGARLYRTGDLVRYGTNGALEFFGRIDEQVKVRGFRIELGEIESALDLHESVQQSVVTVREDTPDDKRLVAYLVAAQSQAPTASDFRNFLKTKLPDYMLPSAYVFLEHLPLTPNGKVDRRALPAPDSDRPDLAAHYIAPRTPTEERLAGIFARVLGIERVGVRDDFFEAGGDSLLATTLVSQVRKSFGVDLLLRDIFWKSTVEDIALLVEEMLIAQLEEMSDEEVENLVEQDS